MHAPLLFGRQVLRIGSRTRLKVLIFEAVLRREVSLQWSTISSFRFGI